MLLRHTSNNLPIAIQAVVGTPLELFLKKHATVVAEPQKEICRLPCCEHAAGLQANIVQDANIRNAFSAGQNSNWLSRF